MYYIASVHRHRLLRDPLPREGLMGSGYRAALEGLAIQ